MAIFALTWPAHNYTDPYAQSSLLQDIIQNSSAREMFIFRDSASCSLFLYSEDTLTLSGAFYKLLGTLSGTEIKDEEQVEEFREEEAVTFFLKSANGLTGDNRLDQVQLFSESFNKAKKATLIGPVLQRLFQRSIWLHEKIRLSTDYFKYLTEPHRIFCELAEKIYGSVAALKVRISGFDMRIIPFVQTLNQMGCRRFTFDGQDSDLDILVNALNIGGLVNRGNNRITEQADILIFCSNGPQMDERQLLNKMSGKENTPFLILNIDSDPYIQDLAQKVFNVFCYSITDLHNIIEKNRQSRNTVLKEVQPWINRELADFYQWLSGSERHTFGKIIGQSGRMQELFELIARISQTDISVLIQGESGTGKELISRAIHDMSSRSDKPFVAVNCGAIPENLLESELFGHVRGSFTGAVADKKGLFYEANYGTIMLDEIAEMPQQLQVKLLRFLQEGDLKPVGSNETIKVNVRVIAATNQDLKEMVDAGTFRRDLYYRLNVILLELPALSERSEDIALLADYFLKRYAEKLNKEVREISDDARDILKKYHWPGNVRELENAIEHAVALSLGKKIVVDDFPDSIKNIKVKSAGRQASNSNNGFISLKDMEKEHIANVLHETAWNYEKACRILGIGRTTLWRKIKEYDIEQK